MKMDRQHVKGDLQQGHFKKIVEYATSKENRFIVPIIHTVVHEGSFMIR